MEQTETEHLTFEIHDTAPGVEWPTDPPEVQCVAKSYRGEIVHIVRGPDCTEQDLAEMMERCENNWRELNGIEVPANALRFHRR